MTDEKWDVRSLEQRGEASLGRRKVKRCRCGGIEASLAWRKAKHCRCREIEASLIRRNRSVADAQIVANRLYWRRFRFYRRCHGFGEIEVSSMLRSLRIICIGDDLGFVGDGYWRRHRFEEIKALPMLRSLQIVRIGDGYWRCHRFEEIEASLMLRLLWIVCIGDSSSRLLATVVGYRRRFKWVIDDGTGFIGDGYQRWIGFLRTVACFLLGLGWVWFFWERRTEGLWENRK